MFLDYIGEMRKENYVHKKAETRFKDNIYEKYDFDKLMSEDISEQCRQIYNDFLRQKKELKRDNILLSFYSVIEHPYGPSLDCDYVFCIANVLGDTNCRSMIISKMRAPFWFRKSEKSNALCEYIKQLLTDLKAMKLKNNVLIVDRDYVEWIYSNLPSEKKLEYREYLKDVYSIKQAKAQEKLNTTLGALLDNLNG